MHIGVFILLLLSGERNFGVRLNKPYTVRAPMDIPVFTGSHADFLIVVSFTLFLQFSFEIIKRRRACWLSKIKTNIIVVIVNLMKHSLNHV